MTPIHVRGSYAVTSPREGVYEVSRLVGKGVTPLHLETFTGRNAAQRAREDAARRDDAEAGRIVCAKCGEAANLLPFSLAGTLHFFGPRSHRFRPSRTLAVRA